MYTSPKKEKVKYGKTFISKQCAESPLFNLVVAYLKILPFIHRINNAIKYYYYYFLRKS